MTRPITLITLIRPALLLATACGGSSKPAPAPPPAAAAEPAPEEAEAKPGPGGPSAADCDKLIDHALDLIEKSPDVPPADKEQIKKQRAKGDVKTSTEWKDAQNQCMTSMKKEDVQCALAATNFDEMRKCGSPPPTGAGPKP